VRHLFGRSNVAADAASRGYGSVLAALSRHLRIRTFKIDVVGDVVALLDLCLEHSHLADAWEEWGDDGDAWPA
jgi:hypothetical protein